MHTVVVFAKEPVPGRVKTRLSPPLAPEEAAILYRAFVEDTLTLAERSGASRLVLAYSADGPPRWLRSTAEAAGPWELLDQGDGDLGDRLVRIATACLAPVGRRTASPVVVIGSDSPSLPPERIVEAAQALERCDAAIGPSRDGGYYLIGLSKLAPGLFRDIPWSTERVYGETLARIAELGLSCHTLAPWYDLDDADAIRKWWPDHGVAAPRTRSAVSDYAVKLGLEPREGSGRI